MTIFILKLDCRVSDFFRVVSSSAMVRQRLMFIPHPGDAVKPGKGLFFFTPTPVVSSPKRREPPEQTMATDVLDRVSWSGLSEISPYRMSPIPIKKKTEQKKPRLHSQLP